MTKDAPGGSDCDGITTYGTDGMSSTRPPPGSFDEAAAALLERAVARRVTPGAVLRVTGVDGELSTVVVGARSYDGPPVTAQTRYDLASLTKVVGCLPVLLHLLEDGALSLEDKVSKFFANAGWFQEQSLGDVSIEELTLHSSGLPAWTPLFAWVSTRKTATANVLQTALSGVRGQYDYSDLGVMVLGAIIERVTGERLDVLAKRLVFEPLGMTATGYGPLPAGADVAATEDDGWRGGVLHGEVHDENASIMDGVSAHAGLFGTAADVGAYARAWLTLDAPFASRAWLEEANRDRSRGSGPPRGILWRLHSDNWPIGKSMTAAAYGHTGFTGTSLIVEPVQRWACVLLTNRVHPHRANADGVMALRREIHALVAHTFGGVESADATAG